VAAEPRPFLGRAGRPARPPWGRGLARGAARAAAGGMRRRRQRSPPRLLRRRKRDRSPCACGVARPAAGRSCCSCSWRPTPSRRTRRCCWRRETAARRAQTEEPAWPSPGKTGTRRPTRPAAAARPQAPTPRRLLRPTRRSCTPRAADPAGHLMCGEASTPARRATPHRPPRYRRASCRPGTRLTPPRAGSRGGAKAQWPSVPDVLIEVPLLLCCAGRAGREAAPQPVGDIMPRAHCGQRCLIYRLSCSRAPLTTFRIFVS
jgi:hypothetical protein